MNKRSITSEQDICNPWCQLYSCPVIVSRWQEGELTSAAERNAALTVISEWRRRLAMTIKDFAVLNFVLSLILLLYKKTEYQNSVFYFQITSRY